MLPLSTWCFGPATLTCLTMVTWEGLKEVKGHQDKDKSYDELDCWGKANVHADRLAKEHMARVREDLPPIGTRHPDGGWTITINNRVIVRNFEATIIMHCTSNRTKEYWGHRMGISPKCIEDINWSVFQKNTKFLSPHQQLFITKHCARISATGRNMLQRDQRDSDECPRCGMQDEHCEHIIRCQQRKAMDIFMTAFAELGLWLRKTTSPEIEAVITDAVLAYRDNTDMDVDDYDDTKVTGALQQQLQIGLFPFICGFLGNKWAQVQQTYYEDNESRKCEKKMGIPTFY